MQDEAALKELSRVRSHNKTLKIAAIVLLTLFLVTITVVGLLFYKASVLRDLLLPSDDSYQGSAFSQEGEQPPVAFRHVPFSTQTMGGSALTVFTNSGDYAQEEGMPGMLDGEKALRALSKYADRPIVTDFIAAAKKDPAFAKALTQVDPKNPMAAVASLQNMKSLQGLVLRFAMRKDFMPFMMEVTSDPELRPVLDKLPGGNMGQISRMLKMMPGGGQAPASSRSATYAPADPGPDEEMEEDGPVMPEPEPSPPPVRKKKRQSVPSN